VIFLILKASYKNNKVLVDAMEHINVTHLEIEKHKKQGSKRRTIVFKIQRFILEVKTW
jgi:hypothetical protein